MTVRQGLWIEPLLSKRVKLAPSWTSPITRSMPLQVYSWSRDDRPDRSQQFMIEGADVRGIDLEVMERTGEANEVIIR